MKLTAYHIIVMLDNKKAREMNKKSKLEFIMRTVFFVLLGALIGYTSMKFYRAHQQTEDRFHPPSIHQSTKHQCVNHFWTDHLKKKGEAL